MDDLEAKLESREIGKKCNKSLMSNYWCMKDDTINPEIETDTNKYITEFDKHVSDTFRIQMGNLKNKVRMNTEFLFNEAEDILKDLSVEISKTRDKYGKTLTTYSVPAIAEVYNIETFDNLKFQDTFMFKGKCYDKNMIYRLNLGSSNKLQPICPVEIHISENLPDTVKLLQTSASDGEMYYNLCHGNNSSRTKHNIIEYENDEEVINLSNISNTTQNLIKKREKPIYVKILNKGNFKLTHLGVLGRTVPILSYVKKKEYSKNLNGRKMSRLENQPFNILDTSVPISYVKKFEIWFRGIKTKKWNYLKTINLGLHNLTACYEEEIVTINDLDGLETSELKIIPLEYMNKPIIRIAVYGIGVKSDAKKNIKQKDEAIEKYTITNYDDLSKNNKLIKHGNNWNGYRYWDCYVKNHKKKNNEMIKNDIKNDVKDYENQDE